MTASLPLPHEADPDDTDGRHPSAPVVPLPSAAAAARTTASPNRKRPAKTKRPPRAAARPAADPGPPPPLPTDVDIVIPPKPPLPPVPAAGRDVGQDPAASDEVVVEVETATESSAEPEPEAALAPAAEVDPAPELQAEPTAEPQIEPATESDLEPAAVRVAEPAPEPVVEAAPVGLIEPEPATETEQEPDPAPSPALVAAALPETTPAPDVEPTPDPEPEPGPAPATEADAAPVDEVLAVAEVFSAPATEAGDALVIRGVTKSFGDTRAVEGIDLTVPAGTFYGLVGPNGAGKTTTLSMIAGLLRPDRGSITVAGVDAASDPLAAKRMMGVLPDRLRTFDRLTGRQLLYYYGVLRGLSPAIVERRTADLARAFDLTDALGRVVSDYSAGMAKKVMLAGALIHSPRLLVLDEPFEAVDPVSSAIILDILSTYVAHGGTVILSSHGMELVERVCSRVAVIVAGQVLAEGTIDEVRGELTLEQRFIELAGGLSDVEGLEWLHTFSD